MQTETLSDKARAFLAKNPTLIGQVAGFRFYEDPEAGDEAPLIQIAPDGKVKRSTFWELPDVLELAEA